ncbi:MAG: MOSC domain-containing protein [Acidobacteria bacterium]|nr:MOSC domain-containing protein [Acidobacteriota bacterium]
MITPAGQVVQVSLSRGGLPKRAVREARIGPLGIEGDVFAHPKIHGSPQQALLIVCAEVVEDLISDGFPLFYGAFGENITTRGLDRRTLRAGQRYRLGKDVVIELTKPRGPCKALDAYDPCLRDLVYDPQVKARDPQSPRWGMSGFYALVVTGGVLRPGAPVGFLEMAV